MGIIFITHKLHLLQSFCDRMYILDNGLINEAGTHHQLLQTSNVYSLYWRDIFKR